MANVNVAQVVLRNALRTKLGSVRYASSDMMLQKIGKREVVGHGWNGMPVYADRVDFPFPAIRFKEPTPDVLVSNRQGNDGFGAGFGFPSVGGNFDCKSGSMFWVGA